MGECAYRIKAKWPDKIPKKTMKLIQKLFDENQEAYEYWQEHRDQSGEEFWSEFEKNFPVTAQYAKFMYGKDPTELSGKLDFGSDHNFYYNPDDFEIFYEAGQVWHFANWEPLAEWFRSLGASRVIYDSEEEQFESFEYYNYKTIVEDILKKKELLPMLMGINEEFNELISEHLKN
jgi:hypothetical protein